MNLMCSRINAKLITRKDGTQYWVRQIFDETIYNPAIDTFTVLSRSGEITIGDRWLSARVDKENEKGLRIDRWGFQPSWNKRPIFNTQSERLFDSKLWKRFVGTNRTLIPANGFIEWRYDGESKEKHLISFKNFDTVMFAGLWGIDHEVDINSYNSWFTVITQDGNDLLKYIHNNGENAGRQPVIIEPKNYKAWIDPNVKGKFDILDLISSYKSDELTNEILEISYTKSKNKKNKPTQPDLFRASNEDTDNN